MSLHPPHPPRRGPALAPAAPAPRTDDFVAVLRAGPRASAASTCCSTSAARWSAASAPGPPAAAPSDLAAYARRLQGRRRRSSTPSWTASRSTSPSSGATPSSGRRSARTILPELAERAAACARGAPAAPTAPRPTRSPPSAARRSRDARVEIKGTDLDRRMVARARQGHVHRRRRPRRAGARRSTRFFPGGQAIDGAAPDRVLRGRRPAAHAGAARAPTTSSCAATRSSTSPRRSATRCTGASSRPSSPAATSSSARPSASRDPRALGLTSPFHFIYRKG